MKNFYLFTIFVLLSYQGNSQIDTSDYFPLKNGNYWEYWGVESYTTRWIRMTIESIGDTTFSNGQTYQILRQLTYIDTLYPYSYDFYFRSLAKKVYTYTLDDSCTSSEYVLYDFNAPDSSLWPICTRLYSSNHRGVIGPYNFYSPTLNLEYEGRFFDWVNINGTDTVWAPMGSPYIDKVAKGIGIIDRFTWDFIDFYLYGVKINNQIYGYLTSVGDEQFSISSFTLAQNYPNPFNPNTSINFKIPNSGYVNLKVYDVLGKEIITLLNEYKTQGDYKIDFDGSKLSSGMYFYSLVFENNIATKKMLLLK